MILNNAMPKQVRVITTLNSSQSVGRHNHSQRLAERVAGHHDYFLSMGTEADVISTNARTSDSLQRSLESPRR